MGSFRVLGNLGGKREGCVLLKGGPLVGDHFTAGWLQTDISPHPQERNFTTFICQGCMGARRWALLSGYI